MTLPIWILAALCLLLSAGCGSSNLLGSSHSVIARPLPGSVQNYGAYTLIKASEWKNGRGRAATIGRADVDLKRGALRFTLPILEGVSPNQPLCLMIVGPSGPVSVRPGASGQEQFQFRNPFWEEELQRVSAVRKTEQEISKLRGEEQWARERVDKALLQLKRYDARGGSG